MTDTIVGKILVVDDEEEIRNLLTRILEKEGHEVGKVNFSVYKNYFSAVKSLPLVIFILLFRVLCQSIASFIDYFIAQWVNWEESVTSIEQQSNDTVTGEELDVDETRQFYINVYIIIICSFIVIILKAEFSFFHALLR